MTEVLKACSRRAGPGAEVALPVRHPLRTYHTNAAPAVHGHQPRLAGLEKRRSKPATLPRDTRLSEEPELGLPVYETDGRFVHSEFLQHRDAQGCHVHNTVQTSCVSQTSEGGVSRGS